MLDMLEKELIKQEVFDGNIPEIVTAIANSIPSETIPYKMKLAIAISEIIFFISQFRINIKHWNDSIIPINGITFCIAKSGASKDSSVKAARKCFDYGYELINEQRKKDSIELAVKKATDAGYDAPHLFASYKDFYVPPNPIFTSISTNEGFIQHLNDLSQGKLGAGIIVSSELGSELASNSSIIDNLRLLSELFDEGTKEVKLLKSRENQSQEIKHFPTSSLLMGSQDNILFDDVIKKKFKTEFTTKLARRSFLVYIDEDIDRSNYSSIQELIHKESNVENKAIQSRKEVSNYIKELTPDLIEYSNSTIDVSKDVIDLFLVYRKYNEELSKTMNNQLQISLLNRMHMQWKALKLSGALAIIQGYSEIELEHYKAAIEFVELIASDVGKLEKDLAKEEYELFTAYIKTYAIDGQYSISLHNLRKLGFISTKGQSITLMKELVKLTNSYDNEGIYTLKNDIVYYKEIRTNNAMHLSYLPATGSKAERGITSSKQLLYEEVEFKYLHELLQGDFVYSNFKFSNGIRGKDNIESTCKWIVLDIDDSEITDEETHFLLEGINHYVVRTSNKDNPNKFRVLIELLTEVDIPSTQWIQFIQSISMDLGLKADKLSKSQIWYSYSDRNILYNLEGNQLDPKPYIIQLTETKPAVKFTKQQGSKLLKDPLMTFEKAFNAEMGEGRRKLIWACRYARELGADKEYCINLLDTITSYWSYGFEQQDLETMKKQLNKWNFEL